MNELNFEDMMEYIEDLLIIGEEIIEGEDENGNSCN